MRCVDSYFWNVTSLLATEPNSAESTENIERARTEPTENDGRLPFAQIPDRLNVHILWIFAHLTGHGRHQLAMLAGFAASERNT